MARARILPGSRKTATAAAAFFTLTAAGAAMSTGVLSGPSGTTVMTAKYAVSLELDYLEGTKAITSRTGPDSTLQQSLYNVGIELTVSITKESFTPSDPKSCMWPDEADSLVCGTLDTDLENSTHGVVIPNPGVYELDPNGAWTCPGGRTGVIWLMPPCSSTASSSSSTWVSGSRKHFLAYWGAMSGDNEAFATNTHELGHVLNIHHCEMDNDLLDPLGVYPAGKYCQ